MRSVPVTGGDEKPLRPPQGEQADCPPRLPPGSSVALAAELPDWERPFGRLVRCRISGWWVLPDVDFENHIAHGVLETATGGYTAHLTYDPESLICRLQVRLDNVGSVPMQRLPLFFRLVASTYLARVNLDWELNAAFVQTATLYSDGSTAKRVMTALVNDLRTLLEDTQLFVVLGHD